MASGTLSRKRSPDDKAGFEQKPSLKMISCVIRPEKLDAIKERFKEIELVGGITVTTVRGFGHQKSPTGYYMGVPYRTRFLDKIKLDIVVTRNEVDEVVASLSRLTRTGRVGDGKIFITDVLSAQRIRTGEKGADAL